MSKEENKDVVRPVEADGIQEFDNKLPQWWLNLFYASIVFAFVYPAYLYLFGGASLIQEYDTAQEQAAKAQEVAEQTEDGQASTASIDLASLVGNDDAIAAGNGIFQTNCMPCHGPDGGGTIGPNLTDKYWLHGGSVEDVYKVVSEGVPAKGMIAWKPVLGDEKVAQVTAFVMSLKGTTPASPKAPQGEAYEE